MMLPQCYSGASCSVTILPAPLSTTLRHMLRGVKHKRKRLGGEKLEEVLKKKIYIARPKESA